MRTALVLVLALTACDPSAVTCPDGNCDTDTGPAVTPGDIALDGCPLDFGSVDAGASRRGTMTIRNEGEGDLAISAMTVEGDGFSLVSAAAATVGPGLSFTVQLEFRPTHVGEFSGALVVASDDPDEASARCELTGTIAGDADGDGYEDAALGGDDCDDHDANVHPGADDTWYDGFDDNCDGKNDFDQDGDGYMWSEHEPDAAKGGGDCDDVEPTIHPLADDAWYDGVDQNCDGKNDFDQDGDGSTSAEYGGTDCDDTDPDRAPSLAERLDGIDQDCDGKVDEAVRADTAGVVVTGADKDARFGSGVAVGDWDGDGTLDVAVGASTYDYRGGGSTVLGDGRGSAYVWFGGIGASTDTTTATTKFVGDAPTDEFGYSVINFGDVDADGIDDLGIGAPYAGSGAGQFYVFSGPTVATGVLRDALVTFQGYSGYRIGQGAPSDLDLDGDGVNEVFLLGASGSNVFNYAMLLYGDSSFALSSYKPSDVDASWELACGPIGSWYTTCDIYDWASPSTGGTDMWEYNRHGAADLDGDGRQDLVLADGWYDSSTTQNVGAVFVLLGKATRYDRAEGVLTDDARTVVSGSSYQQEVGHVAGPLPDWTGDGANELAIYEASGEKLHLFEGGTNAVDGTLSLIADRIAYVDLSKDEQPTGISNVGDWSGDGVDDWAIQFSRLTGGDRGYAYIFESKDWRGVVDPDKDALAKVFGAADGNQMFHATPPVAVDLTGDGKPDLIGADDQYLSDDNGGLFILANYL